MCVHVCPIHINLLILHTVAMHLNRLKVIAPHLYQAYIAGTTSCCARPDIKLTVDCTSAPGLIQWKWDSELRSDWGFCITYDCKQPTDGDYCNSGYDLPEVTIGCICM